MAACAPALVPRLFTGAVDAGAVAATVAAWRAGFLWSAGFLAAGAAALVAARRWPRAALALPALLYAELLHGNSGHLPLAPRALLEATPSFAQSVRDGRVIPAAGGRARRTVSGGEVRWAEVMKQSLRPDASGLSRLGSIAFNLPATQLRAWHALGPDASLRAQVGPLFNGCWAVLDQGRPPLAGAHTVAEDRTLELRLESVPCRPRAQLGAAEPASERDAVARLHRGLPEGVSVWEGAAAAPAAAGEVRWIADAPEHLALEVEAGGPTALVVADQLTPGWSATLDGAPATLYFANVATRGMEMPAGRHRVEMRYRTPGLAFGALLSLLGLIAALALAVRDRLASWTWA
jgi:hypothetical protein